MKIFFHLFSFLVLVLFLLLFCRAGLERRGFRKGLRVLKEQVFLFLLRFQELRRMRKWVLFRRYRYCWELFQGLRAFQRQVQSRRDQCWLQELKRVYFLLFWSQITSFKLIFLLIWHQIRSLKLIFLLIWHRIRSLKLVFVLVWNQIDLLLLLFLFSLLFFLLLFYQVENRKEREFFVVLKVQIILLFCLRFLRLLMQVSFLIVGMQIAIQTNLQSYKNKYINEYLSIYNYIYTLIQQKELQFS